MASTLINEKVEKFIQLFGANCAEGVCDDETKKILRECLNQSGLTTIAPVQVVASSSEEKVHRPSNGYQLFFSAKNKEWADSIPEYNDRRKKISEEWKDEKVKAEWNAKVPAHAKSSSKTTHQLTGYQLYVKEQSKLLKGSATPTELMKQMGATWKSLTEADQKVFSERAKTWTPTEGSSSSEGESPVGSPPTQEVAIPKPVSSAPQVAPVVVPVVSGTKCNPKKK